MFFFLFKVEEFAIFCFKSKINNKVLRYRMCLKPKIISNDLMKRNMAVTRKIIVSKKVFLSSSIFLILLCVKTILLQNEFIWISNRLKLLLSRCSTRVKPIPLLKIFSNNSILRKFAPKFTKRISHKQLSDEQS